jgi:sulfonate transport system substrate-binding protein
MKTLVLAAALAASALLPARAETVLRVGDQVGGVQSLLEASHGLDGAPYRVAFSQFPAAAPLLEALNADALDIGYTGDVPFLFAYAAGVPIRVIGALHYQAVDNALLVPGTSTIRTVADLKGRRIAVNKGGNGHFLALALLEHAGIDPKDVQLLFLGPSDAKAAFASGAVDAWAVWDPYVALAEAGGARVVADAAGVFPSNSFEEARVASIAAKRDAIQDFHDRVERARLWALDHVDETAAVLSGLTRIPVGVTTVQLGRDRPTPIPVDDALRASTQGEADLFLRNHVLPKPADLSQAFDPSFSHERRAAN